jgi:DNA polymerase III delta prime subunit/16S rRNA G966 N2-methylase RsmD
MEEKVAGKNDEGDSLKAYSQCRLSEIYGHEENKKSISAILAKRKLPNGILLFGPSGVGKTTFGRIIAKCLLCDCGPTPEPCEKCDPCRGISSGMGDLSYFEIDAAKFRSRAKIERFFRDHNGNPPFDRNKQVFLFKNFGRIKRDDQEIILKEVQKKKDFTYFVFCESFARNVIEKLKKECMLFEFEGLQLSELDRLLQRACKMKGLYAKRDVINQILKKAKGIPEKALCLLEQEIISNSLNKSFIENIETIPGTNRILIIAPHGAPGKINDEYTEVIARTVQSDLNCYAVINEKYSREEIDLNSISEIQKKPQIETEFLSPIRAYKDEIKGKGLQPLLVLIHGITDDHIREAAGRKAQVLLGYGQGGKIGAIDYPHRPTLSDSELKPLQSELKSVELQAEKAPIGPNYCGHSEDNLNQLFNLKDHIDYFDSDVRSVQLEIKAGGLRGNEEQALKTGDLLAKALKKVVEMNSMEAKDEILPSPVMLVRSQANKAAAETSPDEKLVADALEKIENPCNGDYHAAMQQAGIENGRHETNEEKMQIIPVERLEAEIAACKDFGKLKEIKDKAEALRIFFRRAKIGFEIANRYSELKIRAERRCGEILAFEIEHGGDRKSKSRFSHRTLKDFGIKKNQSRCWQAVAELPEELFEEHLTKIREAKKELTSACVYRKAFEFRQAKEADLKPIPGAESVKTPISIKTGTGDFMNYIDQFKDVAAIITDPPYGKEYLPLFGKLGQFAAKVLKPGGSLLTMAGVYHLPKVMELMTPHLNYYWTIAYHMPLVPDRIPGRKVLCYWKPILWFVKGKYQGKKRIKDFLLAGPIEKRFHPWQQSEPDTGALVEMFTKPGDLIVDPFYGSGTLGAAAMMRNRDFFGIEIDPKYVEIAENRLADMGYKIALPSYFPDEDPAKVIENWKKNKGGNGDSAAIEAIPTSQSDEQKVVQEKPFEVNGDLFIPTDRQGVYSVKLKSRKPDDPNEPDTSDSGNVSEGLPN